MYHWVLHLLPKCKVQVVSKISYSQKLAQSHFTVINNNNKVFISNFTTGICIYRYFS